MTLSIYDSGVVDVQIPRLVAAALRADSTLMAFVTGVWRVGSKKLAGWQPKPPYVLVTAERKEDTRMVGASLYGPYEMAVTLVLHPQQPVNAELLAPAMAVLSEGSAGALTGTYYYALTAWGDEGESYVREVSGQLQIAGPLVVTAKKITVVSPALGSAKGFRLWRTKAGGSALYFHSCRGAGAYTDNLADTELQDELAPMPNLAESITARIRQVLFASETLREGGYGHARAALKLTDAPKEYDANLNVTVVTMTSAYDIKYDKTTRASLADTA